MNNRVLASPWSLMSIFFLRYAFFFLEHVLAKDKFFLVRSVRESVAVKGLVNDRTFPLQSGSREPMLNLFRFASYNTRHTRITNYKKRLFAVDHGQQTTAFRNSFSVSFLVFFLTVRSFFFVSRFILDTKKTNRREKTTKRHKEAYERIQLVSQKTKHNEHTLLDADDAW